jgi:hypothetical protein
VTAAHLARALKAKRNGSGWVARCPAHDDQRASLSIGQGEDGRLLLHCHAGCEFDAILKASGVEPTKPNGADHSKPNIVATYDYYDATGKLVYQVVRHAPKDFRQRRPNGSGWEWNMRGIERVPYRLPQLLDASEVYICEGEKDADRLAKLGRAATTNPGGAGKWPEGFARWFDGRHAIILPDNDQPGRDHARDVARKLRGHAASIRVLELPDLPSKGDVSDWIAAGGTLADLEDLAQATPSWAEGETFDQVDGQPKTNAPKLVSFAEFVRSFVPPQYEIDGLLQRGRIYSVTAPTGHGKTAVCMCLETHLGLGKDLGNRPVEQGNAVYFAAENPDDLKARAIFMASRLGRNDLPIYFVEGGFNIDDWGDHIRAQVEAIGGAASLTIDTGPAFLAACGFADENDNMQALRFALKLREFTKMPGSPVVLVPTHPIKNATKDNLIPRGGSAFLNEMDGNLTLWAEGERETTELHWLGKLRGPSFDPITFALEKGTCPQLKDAKGRLIPSICAALASSDRADRAARRQREDEDALLLTMYTAPVGSFTTWAKHLEWVSATGEEQKSRISRTMERLKAAKLVTKNREHWVLTKRGKDEAEKLKEQAE